MIERIGRLVLACAALVFGTAVSAQQYPFKPIRFIVPFPPGGGNDLVARITGKKLSEELGQSVIVDNRPGASGQIGTQLAAKSPPDGYTIITAGTQLTVLQGSGKSAPYDVLKDFTPISLLVLQPQVLVVHPSVPANSVKELIALAKAQPGKHNYAVGSNGSAPQLPAVPTVAESGLDDYEINSWFGVLASAGVPKPIADRLSADFAKAVAAPEVREKLTQQGFTVVGGSAEQFRAFLKSDVANWKRIIDVSGAKID